MKGGLKGQLKEMENHLLLWKAKNITIKGNAIKFEGGMFRAVTSWNMLTAVSSGQIVLEKEGSEIAATVEVFFTTALIIATTMVFGFLGLLLSQAGTVGTPELIIGLAGAWAWLFGGNFAITAFRLRNWAKLNFPQGNPNTKKAEVSFRASKASVERPAPFDPDWQPQWIKPLPWSRKLPLVSYLLIITWNVLMVTLIGYNNIVDRFLIFPKSLLYPVLIFGIVMGVVAPYEIGKNLDRWNERVRLRNKTTLKLKKKR